MYPRHPGLHAPGPRQRRGDLPTAIQHGFTSVMMDGSLKADGKTPADYDYNVERHRAGSRDGARVRRLGRGRARRARLARDRRGRAGRRPRRGGQLDHDQLLTDPDEAADFVRRHQGRRAGGRHAAPATAPTSSRRKPDGEVLAMDGDRGDPPAPAGHPSGHARLVVGAAGPAGHHQPRTAAR